MLTEAEKEMIKNEMNANQHEVYILSLDEMDYIIQQNVKSQEKIADWNKLKGKAEFTANYYSSGSDIFLLNKLLADMGYSSARAYVKYYGGKAHIILKGYPGLRKILTGTKYGVQNIKVVKMGLGKYGGINAAKGGGVLTIFLLTAYRVADYFLSDDATLTQLVGSLSTDIVKVGITTGASVAAAAGASALGTALSASAATAALGGVVVAIGPLVAVVVVGIGVSYALTKLDDHFHITDRVIAALDEIAEKGIDGIIAEKKQSLIQKGTQLANDAADSVIDYAVEKVQKIIINYTNDFIGRLTRPML